MRKPVVLLAALAVACSGGSKGDPPPAAPRPTARFAFVTTWGIPSGVPGGDGVAKLAVREDGTLEPVGLTTGLRYAGGVFTHPTKAVVYVRDNGGITAWSGAAGGAPVKIGPVNTNGIPWLGATGAWWYTPNWRAALKFDVATDGTAVDTSEVYAVAGLPADPYNVFFHPSGAYAYVAYQSGLIHGYAVNADGSFDPQSLHTATGGASPRKLIFTPDGTHAYLADGGELAGLIWQYSVSETGVLAPLNPATVDAGSPNDLALSPDGKSLYAASLDRLEIVRFTVGADGTLTDAGTPVSVPNVACLAVDPGGFLYATTYTSDVSQFRIGSDGALHPLSPATVSLGSSNEGECIALVP